MGLGLQRSYTNHDGVSALDFEGIVLPWNVYYPHKLITPKLSQGFEVRLVDAATFFEFYTQNFERMFATTVMPQVDPTANQIANFRRRRFYEQRCDMFIFWLGNEPVGAFACHFSDQETYYLRTGGVLPSFQGLGIYPAFLRYHTELLAQCQVARVDVEVAIDNLVATKIYVNLGFVASGIRYTKSWGAMALFSKYL